MTRRALVLLAGAVLALAAPAGASAEAPALAELADARFPDRAYALSLPAPRPLTAADVEVTENGRAVRGLTVTAPDSASARRFGVVLAIDNSYSMRGRPLRAAIGAAREFVRQRAADQPVALIAFAGTVEVLLPFNTDSATIERALGGLEQGGGGSRLVDAAERAVALARAEKMTSASVVLISDGADRGSATTLDGVAAAARDAGTRLYGIGLSSEFTDFSALNELAVRSSAEFSIVSSLADLARVYRRLGSRLAHQYVVQYRSDAAPGQRVKVTVRVHGFAAPAVTTYRSPLAPAGVRPPFHHRPADRVWLQPAAAMFIGLVVAVLLFAALWALLRPRDGGVRARMAAYVAVGEESAPQRGPRSGGGALSGRMLRGAERSLDGRAWWTRFQEAVDIGRIETSPVRLLAWLAIGTLALLIAGPLVTGSPAFALLGFAVPVGGVMAIRRRVRRQRKLFVEQLPDNMQVIASAMRAGHSFAGALSVVVEDAADPARRELQRVIADERLGVPLETALAAAVRRMDSKDLEQVALVAVLQRETGGNTAEVIDRVTETVRERLALRRMVASLTAQGRMSRWVLTAIPIFLLVMLTLINSTYMSPLYTTPIGKVLLVVSALMVTAGSLVIKKIVDIKV